MFAALVPALVLLLFRHVDLFAYFAERAELLQQQVVLQLLFCMVLLECPLCIFC